tara:strand:+ start:252 stop:527 length:276 start_codon:yes stop_codon:yes gene_type:complete
MSLASRVLRLEQKAKKANSGCYFIAPRYHITDKNDPLYGQLKPSNTKPFTHDYFSNESLNENTVRELLGLNEHDQIIIIERSFVDNCMGSE